MAAKKPRVAVPAGAMLTTDSLTNMVANLGTQRDKRSHSHFGFEFVNQFELEAAYQSNWLARRIVDTPNEDALREWRAFTGPDAVKIAKEEKRLGLQQHFLEACNWADLYGGAALLMMTGQPLDQPLDLDKIKKGDLVNIITFDRWDIQPMDFNFTDVLAGNWMLPEHYVIVNGQQKIHHSHVIRRTGAKLPRRLSQLEQGWGDSRLRRCMSDLKDVIATKGGIASLVLEANVDTISVEGLKAQLSSPQCDTVTERYRQFGMMKSLVNLALLDKQSEVYERKSITFSGLSQILEQFMVWTSGCAEMPVTKLWGQSASGLNASGEGDQDVYYDTIKAKQDGQMRRDLERLDQVLVRSALGSYPDGLEFEWKPLYQSSGLEKAQEALADAQTDDVWINSGVIKQSHAMLRIQAKGIYAITDDEIEAQQALEKVAAQTEFTNGDEGSNETDSPFSLDGDESDPSGKPKEENQGA